MRNPAARAPHPSHPRLLPQRLPPLLLPQPRPPLPLRLLRHLSAPLLPKPVANNRVEWHSDELFADSDSFVACSAVANSGFPFLVQLHRKLLQSSDRTAVIVPALNRFSPVVRDHFWEGMSGASRNLRTACQSAIQLCRQSAQRPSNAA
jgi:hypothetical protein